MKMSKFDMVLKKLELLVDLCRDTEPTAKEVQKLELETFELFTEDFISASHYFEAVTIGDYDKYSLVDMMKHANRIWKFRKRVEKEGWAEFTGIEYKCAELLKLHQKINAIKLYRQHMMDTGMETGLREAKEYIDALQIRLGLDN